MIDFNQTSVWDLLLTNQELGPTSINPTRNNNLYFAGKLGIYLNKNVKKNNFSRKGPMIGQPCDSVKSQEALF